MEYDYGARFYDPVGNSKSYDSKNDPWAGSSSLTSMFGKAAGFTNQMLYSGSNLNQLGKDLFGKTTGSGDEPRDAEMIRTGIQSYQYFIKK